MNPKQEIRWNFGRGVTYYMDCTKEEVEQPILDEKQDVLQERIFNQSLFVEEVAWKCGCCNWTWKEKEGTIKATYSKSFYCSKHSVS